MNKSPAFPAIHGPLRANPSNPRYFADETGRAVYLTGSHTWANLVDIQGPGGAAFDYPAFLEMLAAHNHNFFRLWTWDHPEQAPWTEDPLAFEPMPFLRTGPGLALDGKPKWDLAQFNPVYFERLRQRVTQAGERGMYVSVMLFEAWCVKWSIPGSPGDAWRSHPYHARNNINQVDGDPDADGRENVYSLQVPAVLERQKAYVRKVIETVNDLDNVLYELCNEMPNTDRAFDWSFHMINFIHQVERAMPKQHPVGMTAEGGGQDNRLLFDSPADWVAPGHGPRGENKFSPPAADGRKVVVADTDHFWGEGGTRQWVWKSFTRGLNPVFMDPWSPIPGKVLSNYVIEILNRPDYPEWEGIRQNLGWARRLALDLDLNRMLPLNDLSSTGYCLANPGRAYVVYLPDDIAASVYLRPARGELKVDWLDPFTGRTAEGQPVQGGAERSLVSPFGAGSVVFLRIAGY